MDKEVKREDVEEMLYQLDVLKNQLLELQNTVSLALAVQQKRMAKTDEAA